MGIMGITISSGTAVRLLFIMDEETGPDTVPQSLYWMSDFRLRLPRDLLVITPCSTLVALLAT